MGRIFTLGQSWMDVPDPRFQMGEVEMTRTTGLLHFHARLVDRSVVSSSSADDQPMHLLGDTLEIFLRDESAANYWEFHVSANNHRASLRWPHGAIREVRAGRAQLDDFRRPGATFQSSVSTDDLGWQIQAAFSLPDLSLTQHLRFSVCRYDYAAGDPSPVHSSTSLHGLLDFHRVQEWQRVEDFV